MKWKHLTNVIIRHSKITFPACCNWFGKVHTRQFEKINFVTLITLIPIRLDTGYVLCLPQSLVVGSVKLKCRTYDDSPVHSANSNRHFARAVS